MIENLHGVSGGRVSLELVYGIEIPLLLLAHTRYRKETVDLEQLFFFFAENLLCETNKIFLPIKYQQQL